MKIEEMKEHLRAVKSSIRNKRYSSYVNERIEMESHKKQLETLEYMEVLLEKQIPKLPEHKVHEKYPTLGRNYYCTCGVMFVDFERNGTNYCGNCGQRLK